MTNFSYNYDTRPRETWVVHNCLPREDPNNLEHYIKNSTLVELLIQGDQGEYFIPHYKLEDISQDRKDTFAADIDEILSRSDISITIERDEQGMTLSWGPR